MNKELLTKVKHKTEVYKSWKRGQIGSGNPKELNPRDVKSSKKIFYMNISSKRKTRENMDLLLNGALVVCPRS